LATSFNLDNKTAKINALCKLPQARNNKTDVEKGENEK
jgi:hypothetical protein